MQHARLMHGLHCGRELPKQTRHALEECIADPLVVRADPPLGPGLVERTHTAQLIVQMAAVDVLHGEKPRVGAAPELVQTDQVRVVQVRERAKLALEAQHALLVEAVQLLQSQLLTGLSILREVDRTRATLTERAQELEARGVEQRLGR